MTSAQERKTSGPGDDPLARDLAALGHRTARDLPDLTTTARRARARSREGILMSTVEHITRHRWLATAAAAAAVAVLFLFIPFSYERTVGQELTLTVAGEFDAAGIRSLADGFRAATQTEAIRVVAGETTAFQARLLGRSPAEANAIARTFARELGEKGVPATFTVSPWIEKETGNVYAQAANRWREIRVATAGRSEADVEREVASELERMGFKNPEVTFQRTGEGTEFRFRAGGSGEEVQAHVERRIPGGSGEEPPLEVGLPDFSDLKGRPDAEIKAEIERTLRERGIEAEVMVENGKVEIRATKNVSH
jgi:hypothetical protein